MIKCGKGNIKASSLPFTTVDPPTFQWLGSVWSNTNNAYSGFKYDRYFIV